MLALLLASLAHAATWTVDPSGAGDALSVASGVMLLSDGDTLHVLAGTYAVAGVTVAADDVTIEGDGWDSTVFDGSTLSTTSGLLITGENVTIQGIRFQGYAVRNALEAAAWTEGSATFQSCAFVDNYYGLGAQYWLFADITVLDSIFVGNQAGIYVPNTVDVLHVESSVFEGDTTGIELDSDMDAASFDQLVVVSDTFVDESVGVTAWAVGVSEGDFEVTLANNLFSNVTYPWWLAVSSFPEMSGELQSNLYSSGSSLIVDPATLDEVGNLEADPTFVGWTDDGDWTDDDLHLADGSAGIDMGVDGYGSSSEDADGHARSIDGDCDGVAAPDAGAFERTPDPACATADTGDSGGGDSSPGGDDSSPADSTPAEDDSSAGGDDSGSVDSTPGGGGAAEDDSGGASEKVGGGCGGCGTPARPVGGLGMLLVGALALRRRR